MTAHKELVKAVGAIVPQYDVAMHVDAILKGYYTLAKLAEDVDSFYGFDGHAHERMLMDSM